MIIPIRCFTCGKILANKWQTYQNMVQDFKIKDKDGNDLIDIEYIKSDNLKKTAQAIALDKLGLQRYCCRKHMLTHVDLYNEI